MIISPEVPITSTPQNSFSLLLIVLMLLFFLNSWELRRNAEFEAPQIYPAKTLHFNDTPR